MSSRRRSSSSGRDSGDDDADSIPSSRPNSVSTVGDENSAGSPSSRAAHEAAPVVMVNIGTQVNTANLPMVPFPSNRSKNPLPTMQGAATDGSGGKGRQKRRRSLRKSKHAGQQLRHELMAQTQSPDGNIEARTGLAAIDENYSLSGHHPSTSSSGPETPVFVDHYRLGGGARPRSAFLYEDTTPPQGYVRTKIRAIKRWYEQQKRSDINPIFRKQIKRIESHYGSGYASFFTFIRFNLLINITLSILWLGAVILPTAFDFDYNNVSQTFTLQNIIDGKGYLGETWMFYGGYKPLVKEWNVAFFFLLMVYVTLFGNMLVVLKKIIASLTSSSTYIHAGESEPYAPLVLTSWDFSLCTLKGVCPMQMALRNTLQDFLAEANRAENYREQTKRERYKLYARRIVMWVLTGIIMGGTFAVVYFTVKIDTETKSTGDESDDSSIWKTYGPSIVFSAINICVPTVLELLVIWSKYSTNKVDVYVTVGKIYVLRIVNIFAFFFGISVEVNTSASTANSDITCGGTYMGQSLYRLIIIDTLSTAASRVIVDYLYFYWFNKRRELYISQGVLNLVYRQALIWSGAMFSPVLPLLGVASLTLFFTAYYRIVMDTSCLPEKRYSQTNRDNTFFLGIMFLTLFLIGFPQSLLTTTALVNFNSGVMINGTQQSGSSRCGPFTILPATSVYNQLAMSLPGWIEAVLDFLDSVVFVIPLLLAMIIYIFYLRSQLQFEHHRYKDASRQLKQERSFSRSVLQSSSTSSSTSSTGTAVTYVNRGASVS